MMLFDPRWVRASEGGVMQQGGGPKREREKQASPCSDNVAGGKGWHSSEIKLKKNLNVKVT
jgi:hypothetical protein